MKKYYQPLTLIEIIQQQIRKLEDPILISKPKPFDTIWPSVMSKYKYRKQCKICQSFYHTNNFKNNQHNCNLKTRPRFHQIKKRKHVYITRLCNLCHKAYKIRIENLTKKRCPSKAGHRNCQMRMTERSFQKCVAYANENRINSRVMNAQCCFCLTIHDSYKLRLECEKKCNGSGI